MDLHSQLDEGSSDQSALMGDSNHLDEKVADQSTNRDSPVESRQGMMNQSEDSSKDYYKFTDNVLQSSAISTCSKDMESAYEGDYQATSSNDYVIDHQVESPMKLHLKDLTVTEQTEVIPNGDTIQSIITKRINGTMSFERDKECEAEHIREDIDNSNIEPVDVHDDRVSVIEKSRSKHDQDDASVDIKCISRQNSNSPGTKAVHEGNTSAAYDAHNLANDIVHIDHRDDFKSKNEKNTSTKGCVDDEENGACVVPSESPRYNTENILKYTYESDCENKTENTRRKSRMQSPSMIFRPNSPGKQFKTSPLISDQSGISIQITNQSEDTATSSIVGGISQGEHGGDGSEASYQRDERSKSSSEDDEALKEPPKLTKSQVLTFISLAISIFLDQVSFSVLAPFFPREAKNKGVSSLQIGFIFGAFALVNVIFSPIFGKFLPRLGAKFTFVSGVWIVAGCNILFGFCDEMTSTFVFVIFCYVIRCTAALGTAAAVTASFTIAAQTFPQHVAQTIGLMETFGGLGYMVGPVIGGFLYEVGGEDYKIPFIVLGCADLVCVLLNLALLPSIAGEDRKTGSITKFLSIPSVWPVGLTIFVGSASFGFLDPTLSLHVEQFTQSAMVVGLLFLLSGGCYALSSPVWGWMAEKLNISRLMVIIGTIMSGGAFLLMGPSPLLNLPNELWIVCLSLFLCGVFLSASVICSFNDYLISALNNGLPNDMSTQAVVSGIFNSLLALGNFVGPSIGGVVVDLYTFDWSVTVIGGIQVAVAIILALFTMGEFCCQQRRRSTPLTTRVMASVNQEDLVQDSMEPLLKGRV